ncbi:MAG TPA: DUF3035 domain-containing protein [Acidisoma sp.]|jgi:hypothetical protein|uniref:DUF3035 domain-containing protein n=1 Tax=Acidisoma sp. TaxID=1872115 RepID=UPI002C18506D|nr:DUF3035 domain-containing protein [Acidisoma sp.]HTI03266.1 DUF3035 domain-containing protein [Acidisoma sp.]
MMTMRWTLLLAPLMLAGCSSGTMQTLGLQRDPPDEFKVTTQPQLAMPPDLNQAAQVLPAPTPGAVRPQDVAVSQQAESAMLGAASLPNGAPSTAGDQNFLAKAGPPAPASIRQEVNALGEKDQNSRSLSNRMNPFGTAVAKPAIVNAKEESQRLQKNAALGESPANGNTPIVKPKDHGPLGNWLDSIF